MLVTIDDIKRAALVFRGVHDGGGCWCLWFMLAAIDDIISQFSCPEAFTTGGVAPRRSGSAGLTAEGGYDPLFAHLYLNLKALL
jgi:hypothetical protein